MVQYHKKPDYPDWCIIDLDLDKNSFDQVIETAQVIHKIAESMGIDSIAKRPVLPYDITSPGCKIYI
jgi:hypothetical protein